ncbi:MAG: hypothetical protein JXA23_10355, partial [Bacteroidales bacterium]|nr:hypothetical protein [Bacteroidales bacterium]
MKPLEKVRKVFREIYGFFLWFSRSKPAIILAVVLTFLLPVYVFYQAVILPASTCEREFSSGDTTEVDLPGISSDSSQDFLQTVKNIGELELEKAYLSDLLVLSKQDSAYLNLNLTDSLLLLEIKGVTVRTCPLTEIRITRRLRCLNQSQLLQWISQPFQGRADLATIPKIRYVVKEAPKDTSEAALQSAKPMPPDSSSVFFTLYFDRNLTIEVEQREDPYEGEEEEIARYHERIQNAVRQRTMRAILHRSAPEPEILIRL